ncbi:MAG: hypothetical protein GC188_11250 [Alphaproteobacteria bacterium]|nr:hypothetical protein [Alphaproteobacteria bacterium]
MLRIEYSARAERNLDEISDYTALNWGVDQALEYHAALTEKINQLAAQPHSGRAVPDIGHNLRKLIIRHHVAYYSVEPDRVLIRAILHFSQLPDRLRE